MLACSSRAIQGLGSVHRQRGYGVVWQPGDTSGAVETRKPPIQFSFITLRSSIAYHTGYYRRFDGLTKKRWAQKLDYSLWGSSLCVKIEYGRIGDEMYWKSICQSGGPVPGWSILGTVR